MRKSIYRLGAASVCMLSWALLFKIQHWAGSGILLLVTLGVLFPLTAIMAAAYFCKQENEEK